MKKIILVSMSGALLLFACSRKTVPSKETGTATETKKTENTVPAKVVAPVTAAVENQAPSQSDLSIVDLGKSVYTAKCGRCHGLKNTSDFTADRWEKIMDAMAPKARLTDDEKKQVAAYVNANCKK